MRGEKRSRQTHFRASSVSASVKRGRISKAGHFKTWEIKWEKAWWKGCCNAISVFKFTQSGGYKSFLIIPNVKMAFIWIFAFCYFSIIVLLIATNLTALTAKKVTLITINNLSMYFREQQISCLQNCSLIFCTHRHVSIWWIILSDYFPAPYTQVAISHAAPKFPGVAYA
jgi:hypothetical protein